MFSVQPWRLDELCRSLLSLTPAQLNGVSWLCPWKGDLSRLATTVQTRLNMASVKLLEPITCKTTLLRSRKTKGNCAVSKVWFCWSLWVGTFSSYRFAWPKFSESHSAARKAHTSPWRVVPSPKWTPCKGGTGAKPNSPSREPLVRTTDHISGRAVLRSCANRHGVMILAASLLKYTNRRMRS